MLGFLISGTDGGIHTEGRHGDGAGHETGEVVSVEPVHNKLSAKLWQLEAGHEGHEGGGAHGVNHVSLVPELGHENVFLITELCERHEQLSRHPLRNIVREDGLKMCFNDLVHVETRAEDPQSVLLCFEREHGHVSGLVDQRDVAEEGQGTHGPRAAAPDPVSEEVRGVELETGGGADVVDADKSTSSK